MKKILLLIAVITVYAVIQFSTNKISTESSSPAKKYVPDIIVKDLEGKDIELKKLINGKVTVLNFWATWCPSCRKELAEMEKFFQKYKDNGLSIIAFSVDQDINEVKKYVKENQPAIKIIMANDNLISAYGGIKSIPVTFILDIEGQIKNKIIGYNTKIEDEIKKYLDIK
ncbi:MAG: TlpA disulfide reductase family protein [bacterium]